MSAIARLKITLDEVRSAILRRLEVPFDIRLDRLHLIVQAAMGWTNSHLYEIRAGDVGFSTPDPDADWGNHFLDARKSSPRSRSGRHRHEETRVSLRLRRRMGAHDHHRAARRSRTRRVLSAHHRSPWPLSPGRLRRTFGYAELVHAIADPKHERHAELREWVGDEFAPDADDAKALITEVAALPTSWSRKSKRTGP